MVDQTAIRLLTHERLLNERGPHCGRRHSEKRNARINKFALRVKIDNGDHTGNGKVAVAPRDLFHGVTR